MTAAHERDQPWGVDEKALRSILAHDGQSRFGCRVLDLRGAPGPPDDHLPGSAWVPASSPGALPAHMLGPQDQELVVVARDEHEARDWSEGLRQRGWRLCRPYAGPLPAEALLPGPPPGALWRPDPFLVENLHRLPPPSLGPVLDVGCGSGRELVYLALRGYRVVGIDRLPDALELAAARARHHGTGFEGLVGRVRRTSDLPAGPFAVVLDFRVLVRPVLRGLGSRLLPGGVLVLRAYGWPEEDPGGPTAAALPPALRSQGPRHRRDRIRPSELRAELTDPSWSFQVGPRSREAGGGLWTEAVASWKAGLDSG